MATEPQVRLTLTKTGNESILRNGIYQTFKLFGVTDQGYLYNVTKDPELEDGFVGGKREIVTNARCKTASAKPILKDKLTEQELLVENTRLLWEYELDDDCTTTTYTSSNPEITINLDEWFNYLSSLATNDNYSYDNKMVLPIFNNVTAIEQEVKSSNYTWVEKNRRSDLTYQYQFTDNGSCSSFDSFNSANMGIRDGKKVISDESDTKFPSPFLLMFNSSDNKKSSGDELKMTFSPFTYAYTYITKGSKDKTYSINRILSIAEMERLTVEQIDNNYESVLPVALLGYRSNVDMYILSDLNGNYTNSGDGSSTYLQRFENVNGTKLVDGLIGKAKSFIKYNFTEDVTNPNLHTKTVGFNVTNKRVGDTIYKNIVGGLCNITFKYNSSNTNGVWNNILNIT
jgi:hypothetical protein